MRRINAARALTLCYGARVSAGAHGIFSEAVDDNKAMNTGTADAVTTHGMQGDTVAPDWPLLNAEELRALAKGFDALGGPHRLLWHSPRPFSAAALVQTRRGTLFVKRHDARVRDVASLGEEHRFIAHLSARGISVPAVLCDADGRTAVAVDRWVYEVHERCRGADTYREAHSWTPVRTRAHARALGRSLAQLHLAARDFNAPARAARPLLASFDIVGCGKLEVALERFVAQRPALAAFLGTENWRDRVLQTLEPTHRLLRPLLDLLDPLWAHNDWHASNLFWTHSGPDAQVQATIDFGLSNRGVAVADLAIALERNTIAWLDFDENAGDVAGAIGQPSLATALLAGYCSVRPLSALERDALLLLLPLAHVEYALSEVDYFQGIVGNERNAQLAYSGFLLGHVQWFNGQHGRAYLAELREWMRGEARAQPGQR